MTDWMEEDIKSRTVVELHDNEFVATYGDFQGRGSTKEEALDQLVIGMMYNESGET